MSDLVAAARALRWHLRAREAEAELHGVHDDETHAMLAERGFYSMLVPRRFGGAEIGLAAYAHVVRELAEGCPTTARAVAELAGGALRVAALFGEDAQAELFAGDVLRAASAAGSDVRATAEDGGWSLTGTLRRPVGADHATHMIATASTAERRLHVILPCDRAARAAGASGARLERAYVAARFAREAAPDPDPWTTSQLPAALAAVLAGAAATAVEIYDGLIRDRQAPPASGVAPALDPDHQRRLGAAVCDAGTAAMLLDRALARPPAAPAPDGGLLLGMLARESMRYGWRTVELVLRVAGPLDAARHAQLERIGRAALGVLHDPALRSEESVARMLARERLGLPLGG